MLEWAVKLLVLGLIVWGVWTILQPHYAFVIHIVEGRPQVRRGKVTSAFLGRVAEVCGESAIESGWIGGVPRGRQIALRFSRHFPPGTQQRLRNEWPIVR